MIVLTQDNSGLLTLAAILAVVVLIAVAVVYGANWAHKRDAQLQEVARRLGGRLQPGSLVSFPELRFGHLSSVFFVFFPSYSFFAFFDARYPIKS